MKKKIFVIIVLSFVAMNLFGQNRSNDYNEFTYNWKQFLNNNAMAVVVFQLAHDANINIESLLNDPDYTITDEQKELLIKSMEDITNGLELASKDADILFDQNRRRLGNNFRFENKYLLEELSSSSPIMSLMDFLVTQGVTAEKYTLLGQLAFTVQYFIRSCRFLDQTDQYNFTTVILLGNATRELRTLRNLFQ